MPDKVYVVVHWMAYDSSFNMFASLDKGKAEAFAENERKKYVSKEDASQGYEVEEMELQ